MGLPRPSASRAPRITRWTLAVALSLAAHGLLLAWLLPLRFDDPPAQPSVVEVVRAPQPAPEASQPAPERAPQVTERDNTAETPAPPPTAPTPVALAPAPPPPPAAEPEAEAPQTPPEQERNELRSVHQPQREQERPDQAEFLAEFDNRADVQTMAEQTTVDDVADTPESAGDSAPVADRTGALEEQLTTDARGEDDEARPVADRDPGTSDRGAREGAERADVDGANADVDRIAAGAGDDAQDQEAMDAEDGGPRDDHAGLTELPTYEQHRLADPTRPGEAPAAASGLDALRLGATAARARAAAEAATAGGTPVGRAGAVDSGAYVAVFGDRNARDLAIVEREAREATIAGDHEGRWERTRAALENFDVDIAPGSETNLNTHADIAAAYIHYLHNKIHTPWRAYLERLDLGYGADHAVSDRSIAVELEYVIASSGAVERVHVRDGSGSLMFDAEAIDLFYRIGPHNPPPPGLRSGDGNTYVVWLMRRDNRACSTSHASIRWRDMGGEVGGG